MIPSESSLGYLRSMSKECIYSEALHWKSHRSLGDRLYKLYYWSPPSVKLLPPSTLTHFLRPRASWWWEGMLSGMSGESLVASLPQLHRGNVCSPIFGTVDPAITVLFCLFRCHDVGPTYSVGHHSSLCSMMARWHSEEIATPELVP